MNVKISFIHMDHTPALDERIHEKSAKLQKYFTTKIPDIKWTCYVKDQKHVAEVNLSGGKAKFHATAHSDNLYKTIDIAVDKIEKQLSKTKSKQGNKIHRGKGKVVTHEVDTAWADHDEDKFDDVG